MTERSYQDAVQELRDRLGATWEGAEVDGRDEMVRILEEDLGYSHREANQTIDAMVEAGTLRYHSDGPASDVVAPPLAVGTAGSTPPPTAAVLPVGHWQIAGGVVESSSRKGQVTPR